MSEPILTLDATTLGNDIEFHHDAPKMCDLTINSYVKQHPKLNSSKSVFTIKLNNYSLFIPQNSFLWNALIAYAKAKNLKLSKIIKGFVYSTPYSKKFKGIFYLRPISEDKEQTPLVDDLVPDYRDFTKWVNLHVGLSQK